MDYINLVNKVLIRLREDAATTVADNDYTLLIGEFVQQATSEVEDARDWNALRTTIQTITSATNFSYSLTGAGTSFNIQYVHEDTEDYDLIKAPSAQWMSHQLLDNNVTDDQPIWYDVNGQDANGDPVVNVFPVPDGVYNINWNLKVKTQFTADNVNSPVPWLPIVLRATFLALDERGDSQTQSLDILQAQYIRALGDAMTYDANLNEDETIWEVV
jgi:hypothetical protein